MMDLDRVPVERLRDLCFSQTDLGHVAPAEIDDVLPLLADDRAGGGVAERREQLAVERVGQGPRSSPTAVLVSPRLVPYDGVAAAAATPSPRTG